MTDESNRQPPDALVLIAPGCPHCKMVLDGLLPLVKDAVIGKLEIVNVAAHPEQATELGVRSAPWTRIGPFALEGAQSPAALRSWSQQAGSLQGMTNYLRETLATGGLARAKQLLDEEPARIRAMLPLIEDPETPLQVRLGIGALLEGMTGGDELHGLAREFGRLTTHEDHRVRADACHYLSLTNNPEAVPFLRARLDDEQPEVREIAAESLEALGAKQQS